MPGPHNKEGLTLPAMTMVNHAVSSFSTQNETGFLRPSVVDWGQSMLYNNINRDNETTLFMSCFAEQYKSPQQSET